MRSTTWKEFPSIARRAVKRSSRLCRTTIFPFSSAICFYSLRWWGNRPPSRDLPAKKCMPARAAISPPKSACPARRRQLPIRCSEKDLSARLGGRALLHNLALDVEHSRGQLVVVCLEQKRIESTAMVDRLQGVGGDAQTDPAAESVGDECDVAQVRKEPTFRLDIGVAHLVADQWPFTGQVATP